MTFRALIALCVAIVCFTLFLTTAIVGAQRNGMAFQKVDEKVTIIEVKACEAHATDVGLCIQNIGGL